MEARRMANRHTNLVPLAFLREPYKCTSVINLINSISYTIRNRQAISSLIYTYSRGPSSGLTPSARPTEESSCGMLDNESQ